MLTQLETGAGLDFVLALQANSNGFFDTVAIILDALGGDLGFLLILPLIYWSISRRLGRELLLMLLLALVGFLVTKEILMRPRPFVVSDLVNPLIHEDGYGLPSGHVVMSLMVWGFAAYRVQRWWAWILVGIYVLLMMWSRMYAGVHYPQDVIGGVILGSVLLAVGIAVIPQLASRWGQMNAAVRGAVVIAVGVALALLLRHDENGLTTAGVIIGSGIGLIVEERFVNFSATGATGQRILRCVLGMALVVALFFALSALFEQFNPEEVWRVVRYAVMAFVLIVVVPFLAIRARLMGREEQQV